MHDWLNIAAIATVVAALLLAVLRRRGVALPWWLDWLGASADIVITAIVAMKLGQWLESKLGGDVDKVDQANLTEPNEGQTAPDDRLPLPPADPPTHEAQAIHEELQDELDEIEDQTAAELEADLKELARE